MDTRTNAAAADSVLARRCAEAMFARDEASRALGIELLEIAPGHAVMQMSIKPWMANGDGICHGGLLFSLADSTMAFASNSRNEVYVAVSTSIEFLSPGRMGETVRATATEARRAGRTATYNVAVTDSSGAPIAQFLGRTYRVSGNVIDGPPSAG
tara:strand:- start:854 stop:1318 length:465 start_codon:yes stop_codon:yes gene_type:complete